MINVQISVEATFPDRTTPEFRRLQAELGSRHSFREAARLTTEDATVRAAAERVEGRCREIYAYLANNWDALTNYGWRHRDGFSISLFRVKGCVDDMATSGWARAAGYDGYREGRTMLQLPEQPFSMVDCPFQTKRWPLNPLLLHTSIDPLPAQMHDLLGYVGYWN